MFDKLGPFQRKGHVFDMRILIAVADRNIAITLRISIDLILATPSFYFCSSNTRLSYSVKNLVFLVPEGGHS